MALKNEDEDAPISAGITIPSGSIIACRNWSAEEGYDPSDQWVAKCGSIEIPAMNGDHARILASALEVADIEYGGVVRSGFWPRVKVWVVQSLLALSIRIHEASKRE